MMTNLAVFQRCVEKSWARFHEKMKKRARRTRPRDRVKHGKKGPSAPPYHYLRIDDDAALSSAEDIEPN